LTPAHITMSKSSYAMPQPACSIQPAQPAGALLETISAIGRLTG